MKNDYIALIPAYEPEPILPSLVEKLADTGFDIVIVNDGSSPASQAIFEAASARARLLTHPENRGKGQALRTGLTYIKEAFGPNAVIVTVDADGQHTPEDAFRLCGIAERHPGSLILGSRRLTGKVPLRSRFGNAATRLIYRLATGVSVYDTQTGLRAFHASLTDRLLSISGDRYEYEMNVLLELPLAGVPIVEETIETIYLSGNASSHFNALKDSFRIYREILRFRTKVRGRKLSQAADSGRAGKAAPRTITETAVMGSPADQTAPQNRSKPAAPQSTADPAVPLTLSPAAGSTTSSGKTLGEILRFSASSLAGFCVDYGMYTLLVFISGSLTYANVGARIVSASVNYCLNRNFVFKSDAGLMKSALSYFLLAAGILAGNTAVLTVLVDEAGMNKMAAKLVTELLFFTVSWLVQKLVIFNRAEKKPSPAR